MILFKLLGKEIQIKNSLDKAHCTLNHTFSWQINSSTDSKQICYLQENHKMAKKEFILNTLSCRIVPPRVLLGRVLEFPP